MSVLVYTLEEIDIKETVPCTRYCRVSMCNDRLLRLKRTWRHPISQPLPGAGTSSRTLWRPSQGVSSCCCNASDSKALTCWGRSHHVWIALWASSFSYGAEICFPPHSLHPLVKPNKTTLPSHNTSINIQRQRSPLQAKHLFICSTNALRSLPINWVVLDVGEI